MVEKGQRAELNQVSRPSVSGRSAPEPPPGHDRGVSLATITSLQASQYQAGIRCPHQICLEIHQSRIFSIHSKYVFSQRAGTIFVRLSFTASMAGSARGFVFTNHCRERLGSTMAL